MGYKYIIYEEKEHTAWITLNRPEVLNAQNLALADELCLALGKARDDEDIYVIVLTGAGEKAFSAGADISEFLGWTAVFALMYSKVHTRPYELIRAISKPVVAMVNGLTLGGGCELIMSCDIVIASEKAKFGLPELSVGTIPGGGGTQMLPRLIGEKKAKEMIFTSDYITADEALRLGLINRVVPADKLRSTVEELVAKLKTKSPVILKIAKLAINRSLETNLSAGMQCEAELFGATFSTEDQKEGAQAFIEKRTAKYTGK